MTVLPSLMSALVAPMFPAGWSHPVSVLAAADLTPAGPALVPPALLFLLAVVGAVGIVMLLPGRREGAFRVMGGATLIAALIILAAFIGRAAAGVGIYFWIFAAIAIFGAIRVVTHSRPVYSALYFVLTVMASAGLFVLMWAEFMAAALVLIYAGAILITYLFVIMLAAEAQPEGSGQPMHEKLTGYDAISREPVAASAVGFALLGMLLFVVFDRSPARDLREDAGGGRAVAAASDPFTAGQATNLKTENITSEVFTTPTVRPTTGPGSASDPNGETVDRKNFTSSKTLSYSYKNPYPAQASAKTDGAVAAQFQVASDAAPTQPASGFVPVGATQKLGNYLFNTQLVNLELAGLILTVAMVGAIVIARRRVYLPAAAAGAGGGAVGRTVVAPATPIDDNPHSIPVYGTENPRQKEYPET